MNTNDKTILVTGATGNQGGATTRHLLRRGWTVRALTRKVDSPAAEALAVAGAVVTQGDLADRQSLETALDGAYGVYSFPNMSSGPEAEIVQGKAVADAAQAAGVEHFVQGSVGGAERESGVPHFESKWQIEEYVRSLGLPATFLRPSYFMENLFWKHTQILKGTYESMGLVEGKALQMIAAEDIGAIAALVFEDPEKYIGHGFEIAGDELTEAQMVEAMSRVLGRPVNLAPAPPPPNEDWAAMIGFFNEKGYEADIPALQAIYPELMTLETWLQRSGWQAAM